MKHIEIVPQSHVHKAWALCGDFVAKAMEHAKGECTTDQLKMQIAQGYNHLMVYLEDNVPVGAVVFYLQQAPNANIFYINAIGGKTSKEHTDQMFDYARTQGCTMVRGSARESVARLWRMKYGFTSPYVTVEKLL